MHLILILILSSISYATPEQDAINAAARAFYEQQHWNDDVNRFLQHYERKLTPMEKKIGGYIYEIFKICQDRQVRFRWTFP